MQASVSIGSAARVVRRLSLVAPLLVLAAPPALAQDFDGDGLTDHQEAILGTDPSSPDGDLDGYSDAEELARGTDPGDAASSPAVAAHGVATSARSDAGTLSFMSILYAPSGGPGNVSFATVMLVGGVLVEVTPSTLPPGSVVQVLAAADPADLLLCVELPFPESLLQAYGVVSFETEIRVGGVSDPLAQAGTHIVDVNGVAVAVNGAPSGAEGSAGTTYTPLPKTSELPAGYEPDQVCKVDMVPVGTSGSAVVYAIVSATCVVDPNSVCMPADCAAQVGTTLELMQF